MNKPPVRETIKQRVKRLLADDLITIRDEATARAKGWGVKPLRRGRRKL